MDRDRIAHDHAVSDIVQRLQPASAAVVAALSPVRERDAWLTGAAGLARRVLDGDPVVTVGIGAWDGSAGGWRVVGVGVDGAGDASARRRLERAVAAGAGEGSRHGPFVVGSDAPDGVDALSAAELDGAQNGCAYLRERGKLRLHGLVRARVSFGASREMLAVVQADGTGAGWRGGAEAGDALEGFAGGIGVAYYKLFVEPERARERLLSGLSETQRRIVPLLIQEKSEREIAEALNRSKHTVHEHVKAIYQSWGVHSRHQAREKWLGRGGRGGA